MYSSVEQVKLYPSYEKAKLHVNGDDHDQYLFPDKEMRSLMNIEQVDKHNWQIVVDITTTCTEDIWPEYTRQGYKVRVKRVKSLSRSVQAQENLENYARSIIVRGPYVWALSTEIKDDNLVYVTLYRGGNDVKEDDTSEWCDLGERKEASEWADLTPGVAMGRIVPFSQLISSPRNVRFVATAPADSEERRVYEETFLEMGFVPQMTEVEFATSSFEHPTYEAARDHARKVKAYIGVVDNAAVGFVTAVRNSTTKKYLPMLALYGPSAAPQDRVDLNTGCLVRVKPLNSVIQRFVEKFTAPEDQIFYNARTSSP